LHLWCLWVLLLGVWGRPTDQTWGVIFPRAADQLARHPSQIYQALLEGVLLFALVWIYSSRARKPGAVAGLFLLGYGVARSVVEFFREPDAHLGLIGFDLLTMGQLLSAPMILIGLFMLVRSQSKS
jgi:phosphatidylglycerol:prolipoprotein diacylglycerol transferase